MVSKITSPVTPLEEVAKINEIIDNLGGGDNVFWATYGTTTYSEIKSAYDNNKLVMCRYNDSSLNRNLIFRLTDIYDDNAEIPYCIFRNDAEVISGNDFPVAALNIYVDSFSNWSLMEQLKYQEQLVSGTNIKTINNTSLLGSGNITINSLPSQAGQSGKYLTTNGSSASWATIQGVSRNIGEIVTSTIPLSDAGLHLLDGSVISGSGSYSAFVTYIAGLVSGHSELFATEANWQQAVTDYGVCGKFVYDSVNNTVRLPKYNSKIYTGGGTVPVVGNGMTLGLTNGTINFGGYKSTSNNYPRYCLASRDYGKAIGESVSDSTNTEGNNFVIGVTTDASKSGLVTDLSNITTSLDGYYYIVLTNSTKTQIEVDIDEVMTDLNGKADVDLSNCTKPHIVETWHSGTEWYRVWSDGWCEQGGTLPAISISAGAMASQTLTFHKQMADTNYTVLFGALSGAFPTCYLTDRTVNGGTAKPANRAGSGSYSTQFCWEVKGYCVV